MHTRLTAWTHQTKGDVIDKTQVGFQAGRCTLDHLYVLTETVRTRKQQGRPTYTCFVDCRKAFPSVFKAGLLYKLHRMGVRGKYWRRSNNHTGTVCPPEVPPMPIFPHEGSSRLWIHFRAAKKIADA